MKKKVLIVVKTYPAISTKYEELVCTAGVDEDGKWVRIYPIPFRKLDYDKRYAKYQWIEAELERNLEDPRPESFRPNNYASLRALEKIGTENGTWAERKKYVLRNVYTDLKKLISDAKDKEKITSLAVFKPKKIIDFECKPVARDWSEKRLIQLSQLRLFEDLTEIRKELKKLPYKFSYIFEDQNGVRSKLMIEDWELGQLYWNCLARKNTEKAACDDVRKKYYDEFLNNKDLYFILGTTRVHHFRAKNPFIIIGIFYPKKYKDDV